MILLLDTSTMECRLTLIDGKIRQDFSWQADRTLAKHLLGFLEEKLQAAGGDFSQLTGIGVFRGPGSFTGLRIGMAVLNTLADALQIPIIGTEGDDWQAHALARLAASENDRVVLPHYGGDAHITKPRK